MLPQQLKQINRWVCWKLVDGKKKPIDAKTGKYASVTNPKTWATFNQAVRVANRYNGLGIVLDGSDNLIGIDLDKTTLDQARPIVEALDSYTEYSPSGNGIRIFIYAAIDLDRGNRQKGIEVYKTDRFLTLTGNTILEQEVKDRTEVFRQWYNATFNKQEKTSNHQQNKLALSTNDEDLLSRIFEHDLYGNEHKLRYEGIQPASDRQDRSLTDYRLAQALCRWTKDIDRATQLMLSSKLVRGKWFETRGNETWLEQLMNKVMTTV